MKDVYKQLMKYILEESNEEMFRYVIANRFNSQIVEVNKEQTQNKSFVNVWTEDKVLLKFELKPASMKVRIYKNSKYIITVNLM